MRQENTELAADAAAQRFFHDYLLPNGEHLPEAKQAEYTLNARVLNALREMFNTQRAMRRACNNNTPVIWANIFAAAERLRESCGHTLPKSEARLRDKLRRYAAQGYACLVSGKFCNSNTLKITAEAGRQIVALRRSRVYADAMTARGYDGDLRFLEEEKPVHGIQIVGMLLFWAALAALAVL